MKKIACHIALLCGALMMSSCIVPESSMSCDFRDVIYVMNQTDTPLVLVISTNCMVSDNNDTSCITPYYESTPGPMSLWSQQLRKDYLIAPNGNMLKVANLMGRYDLYWCDLYYKPSCQDYSTSDLHEISNWSICLINIADTTMIETEGPDASSFLSDTVLFDKTYKGQPGGLFVHNYFLVIDSSILRSMQRDTTMLSRFPEYYGR